DKVFFDLDGSGIGPSDYGLAIPRLVPWSYAFRATYTNNVAADMQLRVRADYGFRSRAASTDSNVTFLPEIQDLSASVALTLPGGHWSVSLYGRNLLNDVNYGVNAALPAFLGGGTLRTLNEGRVIGAEASFTY